MIQRVWLMVTLLVAPAWAQESATAPTRPLTAGSFDLANDSIRNIVRASAATQYGEVRVIDEPPVERRREWIDLDLVGNARMNEQPPIRIAKPSPTPERQTPGIISGLIDSLLDIEPDDSPEALDNEWRGCQQAGDALGTTTQRVESCPGAIARREWWASDLIEYVLSNNRSQR